MKLWRKSVIWKLVCGGSLGSRGWGGVREVVKEVGDLEIGEAFTSVEEVWEAVVEVREVVREVGDLEIREALSSVGEVREAVGEVVQKYHGIKSSSFFNQLVCWKGLVVQLVVLAML